MVKDVKTGLCYRADKLIEDHIDKVLQKEKKLKPEEREHLLRIQADAGAYRAEQLNKAIAELKMKAPETGNDLSEALPFNLMFETSIGPTGT
jgi:glycyl-tRNA synthetase